ncbi:uncharacterized protein BP5553_10269 [Venustampulla echinocandica]|uniref:Uncharacterized protein n=1 Tax=Venustampulla echinocandica TaxID=2656787 RepID=A0A370T9S1_9HELO|nr:uncharacterized protein BP5553_10269 [Venustampulla echinocandica]RDL30391.1 hypothetical protein BP5553_10269 [Venustampulla echinocandica]
MSTTCDGDTSMEDHTTSVIAHNACFQAFKDNIGPGGQGQCSSMSHCTTDGTTFHICCPKESSVQKLEDGTTKALNKLYVGEGSCDSSQSANFSDFGFVYADM